MQVRSANTYRCSVNGRSFTPICEMMEEFRSFGITPRFASHSFFLPLKCEYHRIVSPCKACRHGPNPYRIVRPVSSDRQGMSSSKQTSRQVPRQVPLPAMGLKTEVGLKYSRPSVRTPLQLPG